MIATPPRVHPASLPAGGYTAPTNVANGPPASNRVTTAFRANTTSLHPVWNSSTVNRCCRSSARNFLHSLSRLLHFQQFRHRLRFKHWQFIHRRRSCLCRPRIRHRLLLRLNQVNSGRISKGTQLSTAPTLRPPNPARRRPSINSTFQLLGLQEGVLTPESVHRFSDQIKLLKSRRCPIARFSDFHAYRPASSYSSTHTVVTINTSHRHPSAISVTWFAWYIPIVTSSPSPRPHTRSHLAWTGRRVSRYTATNSSRILFRLLLELSIRRTCSRQPKALRPHVRIPFCWTNHPVC